MEIIGDAYEPEEQAMAWYCYLEDQVRFPFRARCIQETATSPLCRGDEVEVVEMAPEEECEYAMFVGIRWRQRLLAVPLSQLKPTVLTDRHTKEAVADWHYWVARGYEF